MPPLLNLTGICSSSSPVFPSLITWVWTGEGLGLNRPKRLLYFPPHSWANSSAPAVAATAFRAQGPPGTGWVRPEELALEKLIILWPNLPWLAQSLWTMSFVAAAQRIPSAVSKHHNSQFPFEPETKLPCVTEKGRLRSRKQSPTITQNTGPSLVPRIPCQQADSLVQASASWISSLPRPSLPAPTPQLIQVCAEASHLPISHTTAADLAWVPALSGQQL